MLFLLYLLNHMLVTFIRAYLRTRNVKFAYSAYHVNLGGFGKGIERRILRKTTFIYSLALTLVVYLVAVEMNIL